MPEAGPWVERSFSHPNVALRCSCGWEGIDADVEEWDVQFERDRVVRRCPECDTTVPEWGTMPSIEGAAGIARGPLEEALVEAGVIEE
jgi:hypothetical protein